MRGAQKNTRPISDLWPKNSDHLDWFDKSHPLTKLQMHKIRHYEIYKTKIRPHGNTKSLINGLRHCPLMMSSL